MQEKLLRIAVIAVVLVTVVCINVLAQDQSPVRIVFDKNAQRIDLMTGKQIPNYTQAQRGSIEFYYGRLDTPEPPRSAAFMRKAPSLGHWLIGSSGGGGGGRGGETPTQTPPVPSEYPRSIYEVPYKAVSFIPLDSSGRPQPKIYVLVEDLELIQWSSYNNWTATDTQEQFEAKVGIVF